MFDSTPSNLPVEPASSLTPAPTPIPPPVSAPPIPPSPEPVAPPSVTASPSIQVMPSRPPASPKPLGVGKEPEDIFSDLDQGGAKRPASGLEDRMAQQPRREFPLKMVLIGGVAVLVLFGIGIGVWMWVVNSSAPIAPVVVATPTTTEQVPTQVEQPPVVAQMPEQPVVVPPNGSNVPLPVTTQPTPVEPTSSAVADLVASTTPPVKETTEGIDSDADALTNVEEVLYGTDSAQVDTDGDGFSDGSEVANLFSPMAKGVALVTDDHVQKQSWNGWFFLTLKAWKISGLETSLTISTLSGSLFSVTSAANPQLLALSAWLTNTAGSSSMRSFKTKNGLDAMQSSDGLTTYIATNDTVLQVTYDVGSDPSYEYRTTYAMLINSLIPPPIK